MGVVNLSAEDSDLALIKQIVPKVEMRKIS